MSDSDDNFSDAESVAESQADEVPDDLKNLEKLIGFLKSYSPPKKSVRTSKKSSKPAAEDVIPGIIACINELKSVCTSMSEKIDELSRENALLKQNRSYSGVLQTEPVTNAETSHSNEASTTSTANSATSNAERHQNNSFINHHNIMNSRVDHLEQQNAANVLILRGTKVENIIADMESQRRNELNPEPNVSPSNQRVSLKTKVMNAMSEVLDNNVLPDPRAINTHIFGKQRNCLKITCPTVDLKNKILTQFKRKKPDDFYASEFLTKTRSDLMYKLRKLKGRFNSKIAGTYSYNGNVFYKLTNEPRGIQVHDSAAINKLEERLLSSSI